MTVHDYHLTPTGSLVIDTSAGEITVNPANLCVAIVAAGFADEFDEDNNLLFKDDNYYHPQSLRAWYDEYAGTTDFNLVLDKILKHDRQRQTICSIAPGRVQNVHRWQKPAL